MSHSFTPTVGLASSNADFKIQAGEGPQDAIRRALNQFNSAHILPGVYQFTDELTGTFNNARITGTHGAILKPATTGSVGLFDFTGNGIILEGFKVLVETFVASMSLVKFTNSKDVRVDDVLWQIDTNSEPSGVSPPAVIGDESTPMTLIEFTGCTRNRVRGCTFLPSFAIRCILNTGGSGHDFDGNHFTSNTESGLGSVNPGGSVSTLSNPRLMYRGIEVQGGEWGIIRGNRFWNLGENNGVAALWGTNAESLTISSNNVVDTITRPPKPGTLFVSLTHAGGNAVMRDDGAGELEFYSGTTSTITTATIDYVTGAISINLSDNITVATATTWHMVNACILVNATAGITVDEQHHSQICLNRIEQVATNGAVRLWGVNSMTFGLNLIGYLANGPAVLGEAALVIAGKDGDDAVNISRSVLVFGNDLHNCGKANTSGAFIHAKQCSELLVFSNRFGVQTSTYAVILDSATCTAPRIVGCSFEASTTVTNAIRFLAGAFPTGVYVGNCPNKGITTLISDASDASGAASRKVLTGIQDITTGDDPDAGSVMNEITTNAKLDVA